MQAAVNYSVKGLRTVCKEYEREHDVYVRFYKTYGDEPKTYFSVIKNGDFVIDYINSYDPTEEDVIKKLDTMRAELEEI